MSIFPKNEKERLAYLKSFDILDSESETEFDSIVKLASAICGVPIALISLIDEDRQWFKAKIGIDVESTDRSISFCQHAIMDEHVYEVENAIENDTFNKNPLVTDNPNIRFYAGAPLKDETGLNLGTLCVIDDKPHKLTQQQKETLEILASEVVALIKLRKKNIDLEASKSEIEALVSGLQEGFVYQDLTGAILKCNASAEEILGMSYDQMIGKKSIDPTWKSIHEDGTDFPGETHPAMETLRTAKPSTDVIMGVHKPNNELTWISINAVPIFESINKKELKGVICTFKDITKNKKIKDELLKIQQYDFISKIVAKTKDIIVITDLNGKAVWVNDAFEKLTEYKLKDIIGKKPGQILQGKNTDPKTIIKIREALVKKEVIDINIINYSKSGREYLLNINISPIYKEGSSTEVEYFIAIERDITDSYKVIQEENRQRLNLLVSQKIANIGNWEFNVLTNEVLWSDQLYVIFEIDKDSTSPDKLFEKYFSKIHPEDINLLNSKVEQAIETGEGYDIEYRIIGKNEIKYVSGKTQVFKNNETVKLIGTLQDITEKVKQDNLFNTINERWKFAIENTGDAIWDYDLINNTIFQSDKFLKQIGYERGELLLDHKSMLTQIHENDRDYVDEEFKNHLSGKTDLLDIKYRLRKKDGNYIWIHDRAKIIEYTPKGEPKRIIGIQNDFTERKKVEKLNDIIIHLSTNALSNKSNKDFFDKVLNQILELTESEYGFIGEIFQNEKNEPFLKTYALTNIAWDKETRAFYDQHAPNGMEFRNLDTLFGYAMKHKEVVISNNPTQDDRRGGLPKGHPPLNAFLGIPILYDENLVGMIGIANKNGGYTQNDILLLTPLISTLSTVINSNKIERERVKSEGEIITIKNELQSFFDLTNDFMCIANIDGTFHKVNHEFERVLGYSQEDLVGRRFIDFIHEDDLEITFKEVEKLAQGETTTSFENRYRTSNGNYIILNWRASPDVKTGLLYATARDVTKERTWQNQLIDEKQKAEIANKAKSEFLANMSHEIRTPLNGIIGFSELLVQTELNDNQKLFSSTIAQSGKSLLNIINDILDFSKIEAGKTELNIQRTNIHELVYEAIDNITFQAQSKGLDLLIDIDTKIPLYVYLDSTHMKQIFVNILGNAIKFTQSGEVSLKIEVKHHIDELHSKIKFSINDTGVGIAKENLNKIFETFSQADNTTTREFGGTGLGLNISNSLILLMGGEKIIVNSELGKGSEFYFELDLKHDPIVDKTPYYTEKKHVLFANKSKNESIIVQNILAEENIEVVYSNSCEATKNIFIANPSFDLVIVDSQLYNKENNLQLKNLVEHESFDFSKTNIGIITRSIHDETYYEDCKQYGVNIKAIKPIKANVFKQTIYKMLDQNNSNETKINNSLHSKNKLRILIAEDNSINRLLIKTIIEEFKLNTELLIVNNGKEALGKFTEFQPHLILMDIMMPVMNGEEATEAIKKINTNKQLEIYALTAGDEPDDIKGKGFTGYLEKPVDSETLKKIINNCLMNIQNS